MNQLPVVLSVVVLVAGCATGSGRMMDHSMHAKGGLDKKAVMAHVNPMPNLMPVVVGNADALGLSDEQTEALADGRSERRARVESLASAIMDEEKSVRQAALDGKTRDQINSMSASIMEKRLSLIDVKAGCRDIVREVLSDDQWSELLALNKK